MTAPVFLVEALPGGDTVVLDGPEGHHAAVVRRVQPGERVDVSDGRGALAHCVVEAVAGGTVRLHVEHRAALPDPAPRLVVVQALAKGDRGELAVETMTEVGVDVVVPWSASRCVVQWRGERGERALARWRSTAREAGKQARRSWLPEVAPLASTADVARLLGAAALPVVLHEEATDPLATAPVPAGGDVVLVVGPEGGITESELAAFAAAGAQPYRLGPTVLRTSTAGVAALALLLSRTPRWS